MASEEWGISNRSAGEMMAEIARLQSQNAVIIDDYQKCMEERDKLRAAVKPFADQAAGRDTLASDWNISVPLRLLRAARDALQ